MIQKILSIVWVGPHLAPTELIETWDKKHVNGWLFKLWTDPRDHWENQAAIDFKYARREYNGCADVMRYEILDKVGGFVVDADSECVKALDEGPEDFLSSETCLACYESESVRPGMVGCGFLAGPKGHPFWRACIDAVRSADMLLPSWRCVGPEMMTRVARARPTDIRVLPAKMFNPVHYTGTPAQGDHPIYAQQKWGGTKGYNQLRKRACVCAECMGNPLLR